MTYIFEGTPEEAMDGFFLLLEASQEGGPNADKYYRKAFVELVALYDRQAAMGPADPDRLARFRKESGEVLAGLGWKLNLYVQLTLNDAEGANDNEWYGLCIRRSVIQSLLDDYPGTSIPGLIDPSDLADLDAELKRVGLDQGPIPAEWIPKGLPETHWWWTYPTSG